MQAIGGASARASKMANAHPTRIERQAARWVVLFDGADWSDREVRAFRKWIAKSPEHRQAFVRASETWNALDLLARLEAFPLEASSAADLPRLDRRALIAGLGAGAVALGIGGYAAFAPSDAVAFETGIGEIRTITLSDGAVITLNAATRLELEEDEHTRRICLTKGEALFAVPHAASAFVITTPFGSARCAEGEILVKVLDAGARMSVLSGDTELRRPGLLPSAPVRAGAQSEAAFSRQDVSIASVDAARLAQRTIWREGRLFFDDTTLAEAVEDVARQTGARFEFADPALTELHIGGLIEARDLEGFLLLLRTNLAIQSERRDGVIVLSASR